jgi:hypothetical protein
MTAAAPIAVAGAQLALALLWTAYAALLPGLIDAAGLPPTALPLVVLADQLVFMVADPVLAAAAGPVRRAWLGLGPVLVATTALAAVLLVLLPFVGVHGAVLVPLVLLWSALSSTLRAPPMVLLRAHLPPDAFTGAAALSMVGFGLAGAVSPYLAGLLRGVAPTLPFLLAGGATVLAAGVLWVVELGGPKAPSKSAHVASTSSEWVRWVAFLVGAVLLGTGFQLHTTLSMGALWSSVGLADHLAMVVPVFWIAFSVGIGPAGWAVSRPGRWSRSAGLLASAALFVGSLLASTVLAALSLGPRPTGAVLLGVLELLAGLGWAGLFASGLGLAVHLAPGRRADLSIGAWFGALSLAAAVRLMWAMLRPVDWTLGTGRPLTEGLAVLLAGTGAACWAILVVSKARSTEA